MIALSPAVAALVVKIGRYPDHHGGLAVIRSLGDAGARVFGVHESRWVPAAVSSRLSGGFVWPSGATTATPAHLVQALTVMAERIGGPCVLVPTDDRAAVLLNENAAALPESLLLPSCPEGLSRRLAGKASFADSAVRAGLTMPEGIRLRCPQPMSAELAGLRLPVVVKRPEPGLLPGGGRTFSTMLVHSTAELRRVLEDPTSEPYDVIVQEIIRGDDWLYHGYFAGDSTPLVSFTGRKLRSRPPFAGETSYARVETNDELRTAVELFAKDIGYAGPIGIDLRYDRDARTYRLLDANPRVGACFRLFVTDRGVDVVLAMHLDLSGREVPQGRQIDGRTYVVENYDLSARRAYERGVPQTIGALMDADERAWLRRDDLVPAALAVARALTRPLRHDRIPAPALPRFFAGRNRTCAR